MKVWKIISLVLWSLFLTGLLLVSIVYFLVFQTVLNERAMSERLEQAKFAEAVRSDLLVPKVTGAISENVEFNRLLEKADVQASVEAAFTDKKTREITNKAVPAVYAWLDKKSPEVSFAVPIGEELQAFRNALNDRLGAKLRTLPECEVYDVPTDVVTSMECLPQYTSASTVQQEVMSSVDDGLREAPTEISAETTGLTRRQLGQGTNVPDYLSYLWAVAFITIPLAALTVIYLVLRRRAAGVMAVGIVSAVLALLLLGCFVFLGSIPQPGGSALGGALFNAAQPLVREKLLFLAAIGGGSGIMLIILGIVWGRIVRNRVHHSH